MAWLGRHTSTGGCPWFDVRGLSPKSDKKHHRSLGPVPEEAAGAAPDQIGLDEEGLVHRAAGVTHRQAMAQMLKHRRLLKRSAATVRYCGTIRPPFVDELAERAAMKLWHPGHPGEILAAHPRRSSRSRLPGCRRFVRWARRRRVAVPDFVEDMKGPKVTVREAAPYSPADVVRILDAAEGTHLEKPVSLTPLAGLSLGDLRELRRQRGAAG